MYIYYLHSCIEPLTERMKDGAAFIQLEGGGVFTEVLGNSAVERVQLPDEAFHVGQFGLSPLRTARNSQTANPAPPPAGAARNAGANLYHQKDLHVRQEAGLAAAVQLLQLPDFVIKVSDDLLLANPGSEQRRGQQR